MKEKIEQSRKFFSEALGEIDANNIKAAEKLLLKALELTPKRPSILLNLAIIYRDLDELSKAETFIDRIIETNPDDFEAQKLSIEVKFRHHKYEEALKAADDLILRYQAAIEPLLIRARLYLKTNQRKKAHADLSAAIEKNLPSADIFTLRGWLDADEGKWVEAKKNLLKALEIDPSNDGAISAIAATPDCFIEHELSNRVIEMSNNGASFQDMITWYFVLSELKKKSGNIVSAFDLLKTANQQRLSQIAVNYRESGLEVMREHQLQISDWSPRPTNIKHANESILFVLGPSRAGKTRMEVLLSRDGAIERGYEGVRRNEIKLTLDRLHTKQNANSSDTNSEILELLLPYQKELSGSGKMAVITNPFLLTSAHLIYDLYPNSYFAFLERDNIDIACDIFRKDYQSKKSFFYAPDRILEYISLYYQISDDLIRKLGSRATKISYNDVIKRPDFVLREISNLTGKTLMQGAHQSNVLNADANPYRELFLQEYGHLVHGDRTMR